MNYKYYSLKNILARKAQYNIIIGERSNGKTYAVEEYGLKKYVETGETMALIRRWKEDFRGKRGQHMFDALVSNDVVTKLTKGEFNTVQYYSGQWWLARFDESTNSYVRDNQPFCFGFALSDMEHDKSISYPTVTTIMFDEFLTRGYYIQDEFVLFMNVLSSIIRQRDNVTIFMLGNTVNKYCPYFDEFGLKHIKNQTQGTIDLYTYGQSALRVAVEYCSPLNKKSKPSDIYFAFDNPHLAMIKNGAWEIGQYPHLPYKYKPSEIVFTFFIEFTGNIVQCEVVCKKSEMFVFCHMKTTPYKKGVMNLIYRVEPSAEPNIRQSFIPPLDSIDTRIVKLYRANKFFYQSNDVGEIVNNFIKQVGKGGVR